MTLKRETSMPKTNPGSPDIPLSDYLKAQSSQVETALYSYLGGKDASRLDRVTEASRYSLFLPSKRLRPLFCLETCRAFLGNDEKAMPAACALEMVHTYSLIHDDLPSMDNDDLRRGKPTNHKVYGEATAILSGDALLTLAFEVLSRGGEVEDSVRVAWVRELSEAAGIAGMVLGQAIDMEAIRDSSVEALEFLHRKKTGALLAASVTMGAIAAKVSPDLVKALRGFALDMGLAFQIRDDILDVEGGVEIGKPLKSDEKNNKPTYVSVLGLENAKKTALDWAQRALDSLNKIPFPHQNRLEQLTRFVIERKV